ncbi:MAG TPA: hypothetical protein VG324_16735 [Blastocatellia bacterium]|nr:hypothetical protein [Blastocatellia bacterium]
MRTYRILGQALTAIGALVGHARGHHYSEQTPNVSRAASKIVGL